MSGYLSFTRTGNALVDDILSAIENAGDSFHHTSDWQDKNDWLDGKSCIELIEEKIEIARQQLTKPADEVLIGALRSARDLLLSVEGISRNNFEQLASEEIE
jgi:hypothetical protein